MRHHPFLSIYGILSIAAVLFSSVRVKSQDYNSAAGYIITHDLDTIEGLIKNSPNIHDFLNFKPSTAADYSVYPAGAISGFGFEGGHVYTSATVESKALFFKSLVDGELSLYQYYEAFYVKSGDNVPLELVHQPDQVVERKLIEDKRYARTLVYLTSDCPGFSINNYKLSYNALDLTKAVEAYNRCRNPQAKATSKVSLIKPQVRIGARVGFSSNNFSYVVYDISFDENPGFYGGMFLNFTHNDKLSFQSEVILTTKNASFTGIVQEPSFFGRTPNHIAISLAYIEVPLSLYYMLPTDRVRPFFSAGGTYGLSVQRNILRTVNDGVEAPLDISNDVIGARLSTGLAKTFKKNVFGLEYIFSSNLLNRTYTVQKAHWRSHTIALTLSFLPGAK